MAGCRRHGQLLPKLVNNEAIAHLITALARFARQPRQWRVWCQMNTRDELQDDLELW